MRWEGAASRVSTGANRSPSSSTRSSTSAASKRNSHRRRAALDLVPRDRGATPSARAGPASSTAPIVVLWRAFWLQSTKIFPGRSALAMIVVTRSGMLAFEHLADGEREVAPPARGCTACSAARRAAVPSSPTSCTSPPGPPTSSTSRTRERDLAALAHRRRRARVEVEHHGAGRVEVGGERHRHVQLDGGHVGRPHQRGGLVDAGSTRCRRRGRPGRWRRAPTRGGASGSASRRSPAVSMPSGNRRNVMHRPARCGSTTGAMRA